MLLYLQLLRMPYYIAITSIYAIFYLYNATSPEISAPLLSPLLAKQALQLTLSSATEVGGSIIFRAYGNFGMAALPVGECCRNISFAGFFIPF